MKKLLPLLLAVILALNGLGAIALPETEENNLIEKTIPISSSISHIKIDDQYATVNLQFLEPDVIERETYVELNIEGANARLCHAGKPILPIYTKTMSFPFGTKIVNIEYETQEVKSMVLSEKIVPAPPPVIRGMEKNVLEYKKDETIYNSNELYPENWFSSYTGGGLDENNEHKTFCTIRVYPVRYSPGTNIIQYVEEIDLTITYMEPKTSPFPTTSVYDLVIITPSTFSDDLQKLVDHKNNHDVPTTLKTTEAIYNEYGGVDKPEQIKYFIKYAKENWNITYVLLVGGLKSLLWGNPRDDKNQGTKDWHLPVRYTNLKESGEIYDPGFISDLYYADIYDGEGNFSSWDSNEDGIFAKWSGLGGDRDIINFYPDVYVGRLACRNKFEVKIMVNKIIKYESTPADPSWYNKMVVVGGDAFNDTGTDYIEGELICDKGLSYMLDFEPVKLYGSNRYINPDYTPLTTNIKREINAGCGHLFFDGHAHPGDWNTGWPGEFDHLILEGGISIYDFPILRNGGKLPVCVVGGCHNSQFNVSLFATLLKKPFMWTHGLPVPECWSWHLTRKIGGGSIATIGNTGLGYEAGGEYGDRDGDGVNEPDCVEAYGGYLERCFYDTFNKSAGILGEVWGGAINKYLDTYPGMDFQWDAKVVEEWALLGDPSLKIGGYPS